MKDIFTPLLLGQTDKALKNFENSVPIGRKVGDVRGEGSTFNNIGWVYKSPAESNQRESDSQMDAADTAFKTGSAYYEGDSYQLVCRIRCCPKRSTPNHLQEADFS